MEQHTIDTSTMADWPLPRGGVAVTHLLIVRDVARSRHFYADVLGAQFLTPPKEHASEIRCYLRDPDGHLIEVGQMTRMPGARS